MRVNVGDRVGIKVGDEKGGWGIIKLILDGEYHISMYGSDTDVRLFSREEFSKPRVRKP